jgi:hypothetical protein
MNSACTGADWDRVLVEAAEMVVGNFSAKRSRIEADVYSVPLEELESVEVQSSLGIFDYSIPLTTMWR